MNLAGLTKVFFSVGQLNEHTDTCEMIDGFEPFNNLLQRIRQNTEPDFTAERVRQGHRGSTSCFNRDILHN
jgi:hypothetical protein